MNPTKRLTRVLPSVALIVALLVGSAAQAQIRIVIVPPEIITTTEPVYYEGHAAYWYEGHWRYRHGDAWDYYDEEPRFLAERRARARPAPLYFRGGSYRGRGNPHGGGHGNPHGGGRGNPHGGHGR